jgi:hypothetical protein
MWRVLLGGTGSVVRTLLVLWDGVQQAAGPLGLDAGVGAALSECSVRFSLPAGTTAGKAV